MIDKILSDMCLHPAIENGTVDFTNQEHLSVLAETLHGYEIDPPLIIEAINTIIAREGKYPERQAFNKEGWLVTFPSAEYKQDAIKKGTHFSSDPTHGKGGMNVYYKRKGKQKRQTQQDVSVVEPKGDPQTPQAKGSTDGQPIAPDQAAAPENVPQEPSAAPAIGAGGSALPKSGAGDAAADDSLPKSDAPTSAPAKGGGSPVASDAAGTNNAATEQPAGAVVPPPAPSFTNASVEFAKSKQWTPTPYGEWRNSIGETTAVVGLSGEVVPVKSTDREEFKLFANKKLP
jgi:hypothetical protein